MPLRPENLARAYFDNAHDPTIIADRDDRVIAVNEAFVAVFGYDDAEIAGQSIRFLQSNPPDGRETKAQRSETATPMNAPSRIRYRTKDASAVIGETRTVAIHDDAGHVIGFIHIVRDVSATLVRERFFSRVAEITADTALSLEDRVIGLIDAACHALGLSAGTLTVEEAYTDLFSNCPVSQTGAPGAMPSDTPSIEENLVLEGVPIGTLRLFGDPGISGTDYGLVFEVSKILGTVLAAQVKLADRNRALAASDVRFRNLYRGTPAIMHSIDPSGCLTEVSDTWLDTFGYTRQEVIGRKSSDFLTEESRRYAREVVLPKFWRDGAVHRIPYTFLTAAGQEIEIELSGIIDDKGNSLAILEDVTDRNAAQRALLEKNAALETANEELKQFAFVASHDLQEPLRKIRSFCDVLQEAVDTNDRDDMVYAMSVLKSSAARSSRLISDLLSLSRIGNRDFRADRFDGLVAIREAVDSLSDMMERENATTEIGFEALVVTGDRGAFIHLIANLLSNAAKFHRSGVGSRIRLTTETKDGRSVLSVNDDGIGVEPEFRQTAFEPFRRLHAQSSYDGTGIGLAICRRVAERHGWSIEIDGNDAGGTTVRLTM